jgi:hypothetical protein
MVVLLNCIYNSLIINKLLSGFDKKYKDFKTNNIAIQQYNNSAIQQFSNYELLAY